MTHWNCTAVVLGKQDVGVSVQCQHLWKAGAIRQLCSELLVGVDRLLRRRARACQIEKRSGQTRVGQTHCPLVYLDTGWERLRVDEFVGKKSRQVNLFDVGSSAIVGDPEIADCAGAQRRQRRNALQCFGSRHVWIGDLQYPVGVARHSGRERDQARQPDRTQPRAAQEVSVSHLGFSQFEVGVRKWS